MTERGGKLFLKLVEREILSVVPDLMYSNLNGSNRLYEMFQTLL